MYLSQWLVRLMARKSRDSSMVSCLSPLKIFMSVRPLRLSQSEVFFASRLLRLRAVPFRVKLTVMSLSTSSQISLALRGLSWPAWQTGPLRKNLLPVMRPVVSLAVIRAIMTGLLWMSVAPQSSSMESSSWPSVLTVRVKILSDGSKICFP